MKPNLKQFEEDLNRGLKHRQQDIEVYGEDFVKRYLYKTADGVRYNVTTTDRMFEELKKQAEARGIK